MITKNTNITVDFDKGTNYQPLTFVEGDVGSCSLTFKIIQTITGLRVFVNFEMSDKTTYIEEATVTDANTAVLILPSGVLSVAGIVNCQVALYGATERLTNAVGFYYTVSADLSDGAIEASDNYPILTQLIADCNKIKDVEALRVIAETNRVDAEGDENSGRVKAELDRALAEQARAVAEGNANSGRVKAEADRATAENARVLAEGDATKGRVKAENDRATAELARTNAEGDVTKGRVKAENDRVVIELARVEAEGDATKGRIKAETDRATAEAARTEAEAARAVFEAYNAETAYVVQNKVVYNGSTYVCIQNGTAKTPDTETAYWLLIASGGTGTSVITGYEEAAVSAPIAATDTINEAFGKSQKQISTNSESITLLEADRSMYLKKSGYSIALRCPFNDIYDLLQTMYTNRNLGVVTSDENPIFNLDGTYLMDKNISLTESWSGVWWHNTRDDIAPPNYDNTYIGGNHGANCVRLLTATNHGKTNDDLGSAWVDGGAKIWYIIKIVNTNALWVIADFTGSTFWQFDTSATITGSVLTHSANAIHTNSINFTASSITQFKPSVKDISLSILIDGVIVPEDDKVYRCEFVDIVQTYGIADPRTTMAYMKINIGKQIYEALADETVIADFHMSLRYRFFANGMCVIYHSMQNDTALRSPYWGCIQANALSYNSGIVNLYAYIPRTLPIVGSVKTWDFKTPELISGTFETINFDSATWQDANVPPYRFTQIIKNASDVPIIGFTLGYSLQKSDTLPATREANTTRAGFISSTTRKQYPLIYRKSSTTISDLMYVECLGFRGYFDPNAISPATVFQYYEEGNALIVLLDIHQSVAFEQFTLPSKWVGKDVTVLDTDGVITIHNSMVTSEGLVVSVTNYGMVTLKIS